VLSTEHGGECLSKVGVLERLTQSRSAWSSSSARRAMLAPQSHAIQTMSPSTPASRSPQPRSSVEKASRSVSRVTAASPTRTPHRQARPRPEPRTPSEAKMRRCSGPPGNVRDAAGYEPGAPDPENRRDYPRLRVRCVRSCSRSCRPARRSQRSAVRHRGIPAPLPDRRPPRRR
jgi:hypothetical protein